MATIPHFVRRLNLVIAAAGLVLTACPDPNANDGGNETGKECHLGEFGCPCNEGQCLGDLKCLGDICGQGCVDGAGSKCMDGDVYWVDSCGNQTNIYDECTAPQICVDAPNGTAHCQGIGDCGNGIIEKDRGEECEGTDLDGADCKDLGFGGGMLSCSEHCTFDLIACDRCGNGQLDAPNEQCDGNAGLMTCQELGYDEGTLSCTPDCKYDTTGCSSSECDCSTGTCCDGCKFEPPGVVCQADAQIEYGCPWGTEAGSSVGKHSRARQCSGASAECDGNYGAWSDWSVADSCSADEVCEPGQASCQPCSHSYAVIQHQCPIFSSANGGGAGGGQIFRVCAATDQNTGYMTVKARKYDGSTFGNRPYQVRVSNVGDDPCGPDTFYFTVSDSDPVNIGTNELTFSFPSAWLGDQTQKAYCVTASTQAGDPGYDPNNANQQSWWYSDKAVVEKQCN